MERLRKKLSEQESQLLLNSPNMPLRVHHRSGKVRNSHDSILSSRCSSPNSQCIRLFYYAELHVSDLIRLRACRVEGGDPRTAEEM